MIQIKQFVFNPLQVNCWLVYDSAGNGIIIDPSAFAAEEVSAIGAACDALGVTIREILITHGHFDHVFGVAAVKRMTGSTFRAHPGDSSLIGQASRHAAVFGFDMDSDVPAPDANLADGELITAGEIQLKVIHVPGHSPGGVAFYLESEGTLFTGDTLFSGSIGRTDLPGGSYEVLIGSIRNRLYGLPEATLVMPGHGGSTTIGKERKTNPFVRE